MTTVLNNLLYPHPDIASAHIQPTPFLSFLGCNLQIRIYQSNLCRIPSPRILIYRSFVHSRRSLGCIVIIKEKRDHLLLFLRYYLCICLWRSLMLAVFLSRSCGRCCMQKSQIYHNYCGLIRTVVVVRSTWHYLRLGIRVRAETEALIEPLLSLF